MYSWHLSNIISSTRTHRHRHTKKSYSLEHTKCCHCALPCLYIPTIWDRWNEHLLDTHTVQFTSTPHNTHFVKRFAAISPRFMLYNNYCNRLFFLLINRNQWSPVSSLCTRSVRHHYLNHSFLWNALLPPLDLRVCVVLFVFLSLSLCYQPLGTSRAWRRAPWMASMTTYRWSTGATGDSDH